MCGCVCARVCERGTGSGRRWGGPCAGGLPGDQQCRATPPCWPLPRAVGASQRHRYSMQAPHTRCHTTPAAPLPQPRCVHCPNLYIPCHHCCRWVLVGSDKLTSGQGYGCVAMPVRVEVGSRIKGASFSSSPTHRVVGRGTACAMIMKAATALVDNAIRGGHAWIVASGLPRSVTST